MCHTITSHVVPSNHASVKRVIYFVSLFVFMYMSSMGFPTVCGMFFTAVFFLKILREPPSKRKIFYPALLIYPEGVFSAPPPALFVLLRLGTKLSAASIHDNSIKLTEIFVFFNWRIERGGLH